MIFALGVAPPCRLATALPTWCCLHSSSATFMTSRPSHEEIDRVARPGATIFLTDMHPDTEASCNWKRSFQARGSDTQIHGRGWSLHEITRAFQTRGFKLLSLIEPAFSREEMVDLRTVRQARFVSLRRGSSGNLRTAVAKARKFSSATQGGARHRRIDSSYGSTLCARTGCGRAGFGFDRGRNSFNRSKRGPGQMRGLAPSRAAALTSRDSSCFPD